MVKAVQLICAPTASGLPDHCRTHRLSVRFYIGQSIFQVFHFRLKGREQIHRKMGENCPGGPLEIFFRSGGKSRPAVSPTASPTVLP